MRLKRQADDFVVTEVLNVEPVGGPFAVYRLTKTEVGTHEALAQISRTWNIPRHQVSHCGLKDRKALTSQTITIRNGPHHDLQQDSFEVCYVGQTNEAANAGWIQANQFEIVLRDAGRETAQRLQSLCQQSDSLAFPNYFDEQRFGSLGASGEFSAAAACRRDYERAIWLLLADPGSFDFTDEKREKGILREHWGDWTACKERLSRSHRRSVVTYLVDHSQGFRKAYGLIRPELRGLSLSAFQSAVWNRMLATWLESSGPSTDTVTAGDAELPIKMIPERIVDARLPLVSSRSRGLSQKQEQLAEAALRHYGLTRREMKIAFPRDRFFSRAERLCVLRPTDVSVTTAKDELYPDRMKINLSFSLPAGSYATMLLRGLSVAVEETLS